MASTNPFYDLVGGYYPGSPIPRPPKGKRTVPDPRYVDAAGIVNQLTNEFASEMRKQGIKEQTIDRWIDDFQRAWIAQAGTDDGYSAQRSIELGDEEDIAGVQTQFDLNPVKWITNPEGMVEETLSSWGKNIINYQDFETTLEQKYLWDPLLGPTEEGVRPAFLGLYTEKIDGTQTPISFQLNKLETLDEVKKYQDQNYNVKVGKLETRKRDKGTQDKDGKPEWATAFATGELDPYANTAAAYKDFVRGSESRGARNSGLRTLDLEAQEAIAWEAKNAIAKGQITDANDIQVLEEYIARVDVQKGISSLAGKARGEVRYTNDADTVKKMAALTRGNLTDDEQFNQRLQTALEKRGIIKEGASLKDYIEEHGLISEYSTKDPSLSVRQKLALEEAFGTRVAVGVNSSGIADATTALDIFATKGMPTKNKSPISGNLDKDSTDILNSSLIGLFGEKTSDDTTTVGRLRSYINTQRQLYNSNGNQRGLAEFNREISELEGILRDLEGLRGNLFKEGMSVREARIQAGKLRGKLGGIQRKLDESGTFRGYSNNFIKNSVENDLLNRNSPLRKILHKYRRDEHGNVLVGASNALLVLDEAHRTYSWNYMFDLVDDIEKRGVYGVIADRAWSIVRSNIDSFTPAKAAREFLGRNHYFGLIYNDAYDKEGDFSDAKHTAIGKRILRNGKGNVRKIFINKVSVDLGNGKRIRFEGENSITLAKELMGRFEAGTLSEEGLLALLSGNPDISKGWEYVGSFSKGFITAQDNKDRANDFMEWLRRINEENKLGLKFIEGPDGKWILDPDKENTDRAISILKAINKRANQTKLGDITKNYIGLLERLSGKFNAFQYKLYNYKLFGKLNVYYLTSFQTLSSKAASKIASSILAKLVALGVTVGSSGIGAFVAKAIERVVQYLVKKTLDLTKKVFEAFRKNTLDVIDDFVDGSVSAIYKVFILTVGSCAMVGLILMMFFGFIVSSISPVDPTRMAGGALPASRGPGGPAISCISCCNPAVTDPADCARLEAPDCTGPNNTPAEGECEIDAVEGCFVFVDNPPWPGNTKNIITKAIVKLNTFGPYVNRLCTVNGETVPIQIQWNGAGTACGWTESPNKISFGDNGCPDGSCGCWPYTDAFQGKFDWLVAHESGHAYRGRLGETVADGYIVAAQAASPGALPTYVGSSGDAIECSMDNPSYSEDFAETVGNYVSFHNECGFPYPPPIDNPAINTVSEFWEIYTGHETLQKSNIMFGN